MNGEVEWPERQLSVQFAGTCCEQFPISKFPISIANGEQPPNKASDHVIHIKKGKGSNPFSRAKGNTHGKNGKCGIYGI
jgi:hypothetical protein